MLDPREILKGNGHSAAQIARMRPTLVIGAGGTGQNILTNLKRILQERYGSAWRQKVRLLAFDTAEEVLSLESQDGPVSLEPGVEFHYIGNVPVPRILRNLDIQDAIQKRLGTIIASLPPIVLRSGAKQLRPFGLLALLWNYVAVMEALRDAVWQLAGRDHREPGQSSQQGINVFICGSLVGGTGSGTLIDLAYLSRTLFTELGTQAEFCHLTGIVVLPQAFHGIDGPNLLPNTAAALEELNYLMVKGGFQAHYQDGRTVNSREAPFNLLYAIDGVDERGHTWPGLPQVCTMIAEGIAMQMGSQLGRKGENDFDNLDEVLIGQMPNGDGTFFGSFGLAYLEFNAPAVAAVCTRRFLRDVAQAGWLQPEDDKRIADEGMGRLAVVTADQLQQQLLYDPESDSEMSVDLALPQWLLRQSHDEVAAAAARYVREYGQARLAEKFLPQVRQNGVQIVARQQTTWAAWLSSVLLDPAWGVSTVLAILTQVEATLNRWRSATRKQLNDTTSRSERLSEALAQLEKSVARAAATFPIGRSGRIRVALNRYVQTAHTLYETTLQQQVLKTQLHLWNEVATLLRAQQAAAHTLQERLAALVQHLDAHLPGELERLAKGETARISLAEQTYVEALYRRHQPSWADVKTQVGDPLPLCDLTTSLLIDRLQATLQANFHAIATMTIEQVIAEQANEVSPEARRQQLFAAAGASWNIDRARLPNGGADLVKLTVMGVPDVHDTHFAGRPNLVSTHDPYRLAALTVVAGAPQSALQQYDLYRQALERSHSRRPLYILPAFLATADSGRLAFALASIFNLISNQGTFFYYQPADPLANTVKLANGLNNSIQALTEQEGLIAEIMERVDAQIARIGLSESIHILTDYYSNVPDGNTAMDELLRDLKRMVRDYTEDLRRINEFSAGLNNRVPRPAAPRSAG